MGSAVATRCRLTYGNRARGFHQGQSTHALTNRPVIVTQSFLCSSALQFRGSPYSSRPPGRRNEGCHRERCFRGSEWGVLLALTRISRSSLESFAVIPQVNIPSSPAILMARVVVWVQNMRLAIGE